MRLLLAVFLLIAVDAASAHESWINKGQYHNRAGYWCCGEQDCFEVDKIVTEVPGGYKLSDSGETVPWTEVQPSLDAHYWRCHSYQDGLPKVRCFFAPLNS